MDPTSNPGAARDSSPSDAETELFDHAGDGGSDVLPGDSATAAAPSFPAPAPRAKPRPPVATDERPVALLPGARIDDFEIVRLLGRGAFGHVYLARQLSLDRHVALKVSANRGSEGRTMARLEHRHIVQVFSEQVDPEFNQRLLCMQLVPGLGLEKLVAALGRREGEAPAELSSATRSAGSAGASPSPRSAPWTGADLLALLERSTSLPAALDPSALHDREALAQMDAIEATAWFGARLAEALDFAHRNGVLHRDIKPANILVDLYGRPMLADFNISSLPVDGAGDSEEMFGGTFAYMAPEHLDAFNPAVVAGPDSVTERSDIYSLGLVLQQLLAGRLTVGGEQRKANIVEVLHDMAATRRCARPECQPGPPSAYKTLEQTIARCLEPEPADRFASGAELAEQLEGCRRLRQAERHLPPPRPMFRPILRRPLTWLIVLVVLPQFAGSMLNISYNASQIVDKLSPAQERWFVQLVIGYNAIVYPLALALFVRAVLPVWRGWRALSGTQLVPADEVDAARRHALRLPAWVAALTALGWFPGGVLFPALIAVVAPPLAPSVAAHFVVSFWLSGLIALAYSLCGVQLVVLRALYPRMWRDVRNFTETARRELAPITARFGWIFWIQLMAVSIPLTAAVLTAILGGSADDTAFRLLVAGLIVLGVVGLHLTMAVTRVLSQVVAALTSPRA